MVSMIPGMESTGIKSAFCDMPSIYTVDAMHWLSSEAEGDMHPFYRRVLSKLPHFVTSRPFAFPALPPFMFLLMVPMFQTAP
jgi:hypothetical protein